MAAALIGCFLLAGCGGGGTTGGDGGIAGEQRYHGTFVDTRGGPIANLSVSLPANGKQATTDAAGVAQIVTDMLQSGTVSLQAGNASIDLFGIETSSDVIVFNVVVDQGAGTAKVTSLTSTPLASNAVAMNERCESCHGVFGDPNCASRNWLSIHRNVFRCNPGTGGGSTANCTTCHGDRGAPQCDNPSWRSIHRMYPCSGATGVQNTGSWECRSCHEDKGHAQCGNSAWRANHEFMSCEGGSGDGQFRCDSCHELKTQVRCNDPSWRALHSFWQCGSNEGQCTSCHVYKGSPRCNDSYWKTVHGFFNCDAGVSCASCHKARVDTECQDAGWRTIHNFVGPGTQAGGTSNLCASCHDNDRGGPRCGDASWRGFHCFCG